MKLYVLILVTLATLIMSPFDTVAQDKPSGRDRTEWMREMQQYKNDYMARRLKLTEEQRAQFMPMYNRMERDLRKVVGECRKLRQQVKKKGKDCTDADYEKAAEVEFELKGRECEIEKAYFAKFKTVLTPRQLFKLKDAERDFNRELMKKHNERNKKGKRHHSKDCK